MLAAWTWWTPIAAAAPIEVADYDSWRSLAPLVEAVSPAVVTLKVEAAVELPELPPELRRMLPFDPHDLPQTRSGEGSGFFVSDAGELLTNWHVVEGATSVTAVLQDGRELPARMVGGDRALDLALLKVDLDGEVPWLTLGGDQELRVGDWVLAMGDGLGLGSTATLGIVSGKGRAVGSTVLSGEFLQTDAAINEGNSGGPLFDLQGRVVGMSTAIIQGANTVGFAIPATRISAVLDDLRTGRVARGYLGVSPQPLDQEIRRGLGVRTDQGAVVAEIVEGTPAAKAGLETGDVITAVDGVAIADHVELVRTIAAHAPGERVRLDIERGSKSHRVEVVLAERPDGTTLPSAGREPAPPPEPEVSTGLGVALAPLPASVAAAGGYTGGVLVERVERGGPSDGKLRPGDVILEVDRRTVSDPADVDRALARASGQLFLLVASGDTQRFVVVPLND